MAVGPLAMISFATDVIGGTVGAVGEMKAAGEDAANLELNAYLALQNARKNAEKFRRKSRLEAGEATAQVFGSGLAMSGSMKLAIEDMMVTQELDALEIKRQGELEAMGYLEQANAQKERARIAAISGVFGLAGKATSFYGKNLINESGSTVTAGEKTATGVQGGSQA